MIEELYHSIEDARTKYKQSFPGDTYGQLSVKGTDNLIKLFNAQLNNPLGVFYDLGSGPGHMVMHIALATTIGKSVGIELHKGRHDLAVNTKKEVIEKYKLKAEALNKVEFLNENFIETTDLSDATVIYVDNTIMSKKTVDIIYDKIPNNTLVISCRQFANIDNYPPRTKMIHRNYSTNGVFWFIKNK